MIIFVVDTGARFGTLWILAQQALQLQSSGTTPCTADKAGGLLQFHHFPKTVNIN